MLSDLDNGEKKDYEETSKFIYQKENANHNQFIIFLLI